jgi:addiction module HigA family antidote
MSETLLPPIHPGEILLEEFLTPLNIAPAELARDTNLPIEIVEGILSGALPILPETALRLSRFFGLSERFWVNLQSRYDLEMEKDRLAGRLEAEVRVYAGLSQEMGLPHAHSD